MTDLSHLARPGTRIAVRVTPKAARARISQDGDTLRLWVTAAPENSKANKAAQEILAKALGLAKSRVVLVQGQTSRNKVFEIAG